MYQNLRSEGVHILPVKPYLGPHQYLCSPQDSNPVKIKHDSISRNKRISAIFARLALFILLLFSVGSALAQQPQTID